MTGLVTIRGVVLATNVLLVVALGLTFMAGSLTTVEAPHEPRQPAAPPYAERLAEGMTCWGNDGAQHPIPNRVIYRRSDGWRVGGRRIVGQALQQLFNGVDHDLEIYKFCVTRETPATTRSPR